MAENKTQIADLIVKIEDKKLAEQFLKEILTPSEREEIELRWELVKLLAEGLPQRKIAKQLKISLCKITRGSRELKYGDGALRKLLSLSKS